MTITHTKLNQMHSDEGKGPGRIIQAGREFREQAIERLLSVGHEADSHRARRFLEFARNQRIQLDGLWAWISADERVLASVLAVPIAGRSAMVFASEASSHRQAARITSLLDRACRHLRTQDVILAQVLIEPGHDFEREAFHNAGFLDLATLQYLERPVGKPGRMSATGPGWPQGASVRTYREIDKQELLRVLDASYVDTLDCPRLRGFRSTDDILDGHRCTGAFEPDLWFMLRINNHAVGVLLLNPSSDHWSIELVYLGLAKSIRGKGLGRQLLRHGLSRLAGRPERTIHLAVDELNIPALQLYSREGFRPIMRRSALIRPISSEQPISPATFSG